MLVDRVANLESKVARLSAEVAVLKARLDRHDVSDSSAASIPVGGIEAPVRVRKCFRNMGVETLGDLASYSALDLLECRNFGVSSLNRVRELLAEHGLFLKGECRGGADNLRRDQV